MITKQEELSRLKEVREQMIKQVGCSKVIIKELASLDERIRKLESEINEPRETTKD